MVEGKDMFSFSAHKYFNSLKEVLTEEVYCINLEFIVLVPYHSVSGPLCWEVPFFPFLTQFLHPHKKVPVLSYVIRLKFYLIGL